MISSVFNGDTTLTFYGNEYPLLNRTDEKKVEQAPRMLFQCLEKDGRPLPIPGTISSKRWNVDATSASRLHIHFQCLELRGCRFAAVGENLSAVRRAGTASPTSKESRKSRARNLVIGGRPFRIQTENLLRHLLTCRQKV
jgi:hypothetical protein